jgi:GxxExxY protein
MLVHGDECYRILGACFAVYRDKGSGFLETVYQECLELELEHRGIPWQRKVPLTLYYRGIQLKAFYEADTICYGKIILELKAVDTIADEHRAQLSELPGSYRLRAWAARKLRPLPQARIPAAGQHPEQVVSPSPFALL